MRTKYRTTNWARYKAALKSPTTPSATPPSCLSCWPKFPKKNPLITSVLAALTTRMRATPPSRKEEPWPLCHHTRVDGHGRRTPQVYRPAMMPCVPASFWGAKSGRAGAATTAQVWWKPRCTASSAQVSASVREPSSVTLLSCMCASPCSTASRSLVVLKRWPWHNRVWGSGASHLGTDLCNKAQLFSAARKSHLQPPACPN